MSLFRLVVSETSGVVALPCGLPFPLYFEESLYDQFPVDWSGNCSTIAGFRQEEQQNGENGPQDNRLQTMHILENALLLDETQPFEWQFFSTMPEDQRLLCQLHRVSVREGSDCGDALLRHLFMGACGLWQGKGECVACENVSHGLRGPAEVASMLVGIILRLEEHYLMEHLAKIAHAIRLVSSGAKVKCWKLVSMLDHFRLECCVDTHSVEPKDLFGSFEWLDRVSLLSVGFIHGLVLTGSSKGMRDVITSHLSTGECMLHLKNNHPHCLLLVQRYLRETDEKHQSLLQLQILGAVSPFIKLLPLWRLLRLHTVPFELGLPKFGSEPKVRT